MNLTVARTPSKLTSLLLAAGVSQSSVDTHLKITAGDIRDRESVRKVLQVSEDRVSELIICGIGMVLSMSFSGPPPDMTLCADTIDSVADVLRDLRPTNKPIFCGISTTGIDEQRDVPYLFSPLYHVLLAIPHRDKRIYEQKIEAGVQEGLFAGKVLVRASLLTNGDEQGESKLRVSWKEDGKESGKPAIGYTVSRKDVGGWIFRHAIEDVDNWSGKTVTVTY